VYAKGQAGEGLDKNPTMQMQPTGVDGVYYTGKAAEVIDTVEETLPDRREGPEHAFRVIKTTIKKELLDTGVVRVTRVEMVYDGYSGKYLTMNKEQKMKPKLYFHSTQEWDDDEEFQMQQGTSKVADDDVGEWNTQFRSKEEEEYQRVMAQGIADRTYETKVVNNAAGKGDFGWDGVHRYPGGKPENPKQKKPKQKKPLFGKKKKAPKEEEEEDAWKGFDDKWEDDSEDEEKKNKGKKKGGKIFGKKKSSQQQAKKKSNDDDLMGEDVEAYKLKNPNKANGEREYMQDDGSGMGGFGSGEQWGANAKQHTGKHAAGGSHFTHGDMWK
jgi:hypothetical protein